MKATAQEYSYHQRMLDEADLTAFAELAEWILPELLKALRRRAGRDADDALVEQAAHDALLAYQANPRHYDPTRLALVAYLTMVGYGDFQNARAKEARHAGKQLSLTDDAGEQIDLPGEDEIAALLERLESECLWAHVEAAIPDATEREVVRLIVTGERATAVFAAALGITHLPELEQRREVKRAKDRLLKRLQAIGKRLQNHV